MTRKTGAKQVQNQCNFLTSEEKAIVEFLKESPKPYSEIVTKLKSKSKIKDRRTVNKLLNSLERRYYVFRLKIDGKIFFKLNIFPKKINLFFNLVDQLGFPELGEVKNEVIRRYPAASFEMILKRHREFLRLTNPKAKSIIELLKDFEGDKYDVPV